MIDKREALLGRCCNIWFVGIILIVAFYAGCWGNDLAREPIVAVALFDLYALAMPLFLALFGPWYLKKKNPHAWMD